MAKLWWVIAHPWKIFAVITTIEITILANNKTRNFLDLLCLLVRNCLAELSPQFLTSVEMIKDMASPRCGFSIYKVAIFASVIGSLLKHTPEVFLLLQQSQNWSSYWKEIMLEVLNSLLNIQKFQFQSLKGRNIFLSESNLSLFKTLTEIEYFPNFLSSFAVLRQRHNLVQMLFLLQ